MKMNTKKFLALLLMLPLLTYCGPKNNPEENGKEQEQQNPGGEENTNQGQDEELYTKAAPEVKNGGSVLATNPNAEKFLAEVDYPDKDISFTKVVDYYGGFNCVLYDENGNPSPSGKEVTKPVSDYPSSYSIRWTKADLEGAKTLHLADNTGWSQDQSIKAGAAYINITNLIPGATYTYKVSADEGGKVITEGSFTTTGHIHQGNFCRNVRDLGGWTTLDGKKVKFRKIYRGGRMEENGGKTAKQEAKDQGIGAELDLRNSDRLKAPAIGNIDFLAPGIEQGGKYMLENGNEDGNFTKQCFEFVVNSLRQNKGVYFHCSLGRDRTGTLGILLLGLLGVREGDISKEYEVTYFSPMGYSVSSSEDVVDGKTWAERHPDLAAQGKHYPYYVNTRNNWVYSEAAPYFWSKSKDGTFKNGVENYLLNVAGVSQKDIDDFRAMMLE